MKTDGISQKAHISEYTTAGTSTKYSLSVLKRIYKENFPALLSESNQTFAKITAKRTISKKNIESYQMALELREVSNELCKFLEPNVHSSIKKFPKGKISETLKIQKNLLQWLKNQSTITDHHEHACMKILSCHAQSSKTLTLWGLNKLTNLPSLESLSSLTELHIIYCSNLTHLPPLESLTGIKILNLQGCSSLTILPHLTGLTGITQLRLSRCTSLSDISALQELSLLTDLCLQGCSRLTDIPEGLAYLPKKCHINSSNAGLDDRASLAFQDALNRARRSNPNLGPRWTNTTYERPIPKTQTFAETISQYLELTQNAFPNKDLSKIQTENLTTTFSEQERDQMHTFLCKLKETHDFKNSRSRHGVLITVHQILLTCLNNPKIKEEILILVQDALDSCSDRVAISLNRMEVARRLQDVKEKNNLKNIAHFLITYQRLQLVQEKAVQIIKDKNLGDAIEPMLYLQIKLKEVLNLPISTEGMLYPLMAQITEEELISIGREILVLSDTPEKQINILSNTSFTPTYDNNGKVIKYGDLSPTNPFLLDIRDLWEKFLKEQYPDAFKKIEPPPEDKHLKDYLNAKEYQKYQDFENLISEIHKGKKQALVHELTTEIMTEAEKSK